MIVRPDRSSESSCQDRHYRIKERDFLIGKCDYFQEGLVIIFGARIQKCATANFIQPAMSHTCPELSQDQGVSLQHRRGWRNYCDIVSSEIFELLHCPLVQLVARIDGCEQRSCIREHRPFQSSDSAK